MSWVTRVLEVTPDQTGTKGKQEFSGKRAIEEIEVKLEQRENKATRAQRAPRVS